MTKDKNNKGSSNDRVLKEEDIREIIAAFEVDDRFLQTLEKGMEEYKEALEGLKNR